MWTGSVSFGLVNIPVKVYLATEDREFSFNSCEKIVNDVHKIPHPLVNSD